jgi:hypothetical protein
MFSLCVLQLKMGKPRQQDKVWSSDLISARICCNEERTYSETQNLQSALWSVGKRKHTIIVWMQECVQYMKWSPITYENCLSDIHNDEFPEECTNYKCVGKHTAVLNCIEVYRADDWQLLTWTCPSLSTIVTSTMYSSSHLYLYIIHNVTLYVRECACLCVSARLWVCVCVYVCGVTFSFCFFWRAMGAGTCIWLDHKSVYVLYIVSFEYKR